MLTMSDTKSAYGRRLVTPYAFIDTEAFRAAGLDWRSRTWKSLIDLAENGTLLPVITSITTREVEARLTEALMEAEAAAKKHSAVFGQFGEGYPFGAGEEKHGDRRSELLSRFRKFLKKAKFTDIPIEADVDAVLEDYFAGAPPFGEGKKKSEFPDAFVVASLLAWLRPGRPKMYVVGKDPDMVKFCAGRDDLIKLDSVAELLSLALASSELLTRLDAHVRADKRMLEKLRQQLNAYRARRLDINVENVEFDDLEIDSVLLVDELQGGEEFVLEVEVVSQVEVEVRESGHEYVMSHRGEPDIEMITRQARPSSSAVVYLEVLISATDNDGEIALATTDWAITSGEVEIKLPRQFSRRTINLEPQ